MVDSVTYEPLIFDSYTAPQPGNHTHHPQPELHRSYTVNSYPLGSQKWHKSSNIPWPSFISESLTQPCVHSRFIHKLSNCCSFWMQDHARTNDCSMTVCIGNDAMISLDISHIYGALFIDLPKVSDTVDCTFLLQQFKRDRFYCSLV